MAIRYEKKTKIFKANSAYITTVPKVLIEMLSVGSGDRLCWKFDGESIRVEIEKKDNQR